MESTISSKGQVTVPKSIRTRLGVTQGDRIVWISRDDGVVEVRKVAAGELEQLVGMLGRPPIQATVEEMDDAIRERFRRAGG